MDTETCRLDLHILKANSISYSPFISFSSALFLFWKLPLYLDYFLSYWLTGNSSRDEQNWYLCRSKLEAIFIHQEQNPFPHLQESCPTKPVCSLRAGLFLSECSGLWRWRPKPFGIAQDALLQTNPSVAVFAPVCVQNASFLICLLSSFKRLESMGKTYALPF